ncbi:DUF1513 domain-containing protein [Thiolapillus sp.]
MTKKDLILGGGQYLVPGQSAEEMRFVFSVLQPEQDKPNLIDTAFLPHALALKPDQPTTMAVFEKKGPGACEIDLNSMSLTRVIETVPQRHFYGHGAYSADASLLYCTESYLDDFKGVIAVRDADSHQLLGEFPTYGEEPHECQLIDDGKVMVVTNGGGPLGGDAPCVTYIDVQTEKLLERVEMTSEQINTGHFALDADGGLIVVSAPRAGLELTDNGGVSIKPAGAGMLTKEEPADVVARMKGEALSVAIHAGTGVAAVAHPDGDMVTFWSMKDGSFVKAMDFPRPRGICLNTEDSGFYISYGSDTLLGFVHAQTLEEDADRVRTSTFQSGSHVFNWIRDVESLGFDLQL